MSATAVLTRRLPGRRWAPPELPRGAAQTAARLTGPASIVAASLSIHTSAAVAVTAFAAFGTAGTASLRFAAGALGLLALTRPRLRGRDAAAWRAIAALGATTSLASLCLYEAISRIPLGTAVTLQFLGPLAVALAGARRRLDVACAIAAGAGVVLLTGPSGAEPAGVGFALAAAALVAASIRASELTGERTAGLEGLALGIAFAAVCLLPLSVPAALGAQRLEELGAVLAIGVLGSVIPHALFFDAVVRVGARMYGILLSLDPAVAAFAGFAWLGQSLGVADLAGVALVMGASAVAVATRPPPRRRA